ncbi:Sec-independent protein translocase protein TatB [Aquamicrobium sp. NLF2-7]|uniref:Sec-independent protein translocase protein TatB n=1 Tax=Aquamicrobium sp. NLF2-7 TaxID=2918753 RepID=UPI001EFA45E4|nr:Sec-independent protein translocase protein TatB [Aquamicrobium sp. NLF2-7]MCG8270217.1 Sec-independent protein translocase protein TatB [Aquamicrobium sp. NLF2-7]
MLDVGWSEMLVIAIVMIVVVGPKDLPKMLRTFGRMTTKMRGMANDFQRQFNEAIKEAELDDVKKSVDSLRSLNPAAEIRKQLNPFEKAAADVRSSIDDAGKLKATPVPEVAPAASDAPFPAMTDASVPPEQTSVAARTVKTPAKAATAKTSAAKADGKASVAAAPPAKKVAAAKAVKAPAAKKAAAPKAPAVKKAEAPKALAPKAKAAAPKAATPKPAKTDAAAPKTAEAVKPAAAKPRTRTASKTTRTPK